MNIEYHTSIPKTYIDSGKKHKPKNIFWAILYNGTKNATSPVLPLDALAQELEL